MERVRMRGKEKNDEYRKEEITKKTIHKIMDYIYGTVQ
jgi:hypothetical protein